MKKSLIISLALILAACGSNLQEPEQKSNNTIDAISEVQDDGDTEEVKIGHWNGEDCDSEWYGKDCNSKCDCLHGECNSGVLGDGFCNCDENWSGDRCDTVSDDELCIWQGNENITNKGYCRQYTNIGSQVWYRYYGPLKTGNHIWSKERFDEEIQYWKQMKNELLNNKREKLPSWTIPTYEDWKLLIDFVNTKYKEYGAIDVAHALIHSADNRIDWDVFGFYANGLNRLEKKLYFWGYNFDEIQPYSLFVIDTSNNTIFVTKDLEYIENVWNNSEIQLRKINNIYKKPCISQGDYATICQY